MQYSVREPVKWDIFKLAEISERLLKESPTYAPLTFDKKKCENYLFAAMAGEISDLFMRVIVDENNEPVGGIICTIETPLYTHDKVAILHYR